jgi:hypothetical protein
MNPNRSRVSGSPWEVDRVVLVAAAIALGAGSLLFSALAPTGSWINQVHDTAVWYENDPGGYYLASAHEAFPPKGSLTFYGHPGVPLQLLLCAIQWLFFAVARRDGMGFSAVCARHLPAIFTLSKLAMTAAHLAAIGALYRFSRRWLETPRARAIAIGAYATSFPVLYYISRISPEPFAVLFFLLTFLFLWRAQETGAVRPAVVSGACAIAGVFSKFHLLFLLPWVAPALLWATTRDPRRGLRQLLGYAAGALGCAALIAPFFSPRQFLANWVAVARQSPGAHVSAAGSFAIGGFSPLALIPSVSNLSGFFFYFELPFVLCAAWGIALLWLRRADRRPDLVAVAAVVSGSLLTWFFRAWELKSFFGFHYLFLALAVGSLGVAETCDRLFRENGTRWDRAIVFGALFVLHQAACWSVLDSRARDIHKYRRFHRPYFTAASLPGESPIGILEGRTPFSARQAAGLELGRLLDAFGARFVAVVKRSPGWRADLGRHGVSMVIELDDDGAPSPPRPLAAAR